MYALCLHEVARPLYAMAKTQPLSGSSTPPMNEFTTHSLDPPTNETAAAAAVAQDA